jgi:hypothetical protein
MWGFNVKALDPSSECDVRKIVKEVAERLTTHIGFGVEMADGRWDHLRLTRD